MLGCDLPTPGAYIWTPRHSRIASKRRYEWIEAATHLRMRDMREETPAPSEWPVNRMLKSLQRGQSIRLLTDPSSKHSGLQPLTIMSSSSPKSRISSTEEQ